MSGIFFACKLALCCDAIKMSFLSTGFAAAVFYLGHQDKTAHPLYMLTLGTAGAGIFFIMTLLLTRSPLRLQLEKLLGPPAQKILKGFR